MLFDILEYKFFEVRECILFIFVILVIIVVFDLL